MELWLFLGLGFLLLVLLAARNGAFQRGDQGDRETRSEFPQIQPGGRSGESIRDPRAKLDTGDHLGRR